MTPASDQDVRITLRLPEEVHAWLSERSADEEVSLNRLIVEACEGARGREGINRVLASQVTTPEGEAPAFRLEEKTNQAPPAYTAVVDGVALGYLDIRSVADSLTEYERKTLGYKGNGIYPLMLTVSNRFSILVETYDELWRWCWFLAQAVATAQGKVNHVVSGGSYTEVEGVPAAYPPPLPESEYGQSSARFGARLAFDMPYFCFDGDRPDGQVSTEDRIVRMLTEMTRVAAAWGCTGRVMFDGIHSVGGDQLPRSIVHYPKDNVLGLIEADYGALGLAEGPDPILANAIRPEVNTDDTPPPTVERDTTTIPTTGFPAYRLRQGMEIVHSGAVWTVMAKVTHTEEEPQRLAIPVQTIDWDGTLIERVSLWNLNDEVQAVIDTTKDDASLFESDGSDAPSKAMVAQIAEQLANTVSWDAPDAEPEEGAVRLQTSYSDGPGLVAKTPEDLDDLAEQAIGPGIDLREQQEQEERLGIDDESRQPGETRLLEDEDPSLQTTDRAAMRASEGIFDRPGDISPSEDAALRARQEIRSERLGTNPEDVMVADATLRRPGLSGLLD